uniref:Uncharacterized protein n=1 Tax=Schizaphis graminum TaxID=13262 RepID=A0A2S2NND0_SCHGA
MDFDADDRAIALVIRTICARGRQWTRTTGQISVSKNPRRDCSHSIPKPSPTTQLFVFSPCPRRIKHSECTKTGPGGSDYRRHNVVIRGGGLTSYFSISPETPHRHKKNNCDWVTENQYNTEVRH